MSAYICNLIVPGFPKCGTSSFHEYLDQHQDICMSQPKEPHYFSVNKRWENGTSSHNALFSKAPGICKYYGESSTTYCIYEPAIERINKSLVSPKVVLLLRDPLERIISHYNWLYSLGLEKRPILNAIEQSGYVFDPDNSLHGNYTAYLAFSAYSKFVPLWKDVFEERNVMLVNAMELREKPKIVLNSVFKFLGLSKKVDLIPISKNITKNTRPVGLPIWASAAKKMTPKPLRDLVKSNSRVKKVWRSSIVKKKIQPPVVTSIEMESIRKLLEKDLVFYKVQFENKQVVGLDQSAR